MWQESDYMPEAPDTAQGGEDPAQQEHRPDQINGVDHQRTPIDWAIVCDRLAKGDEQALKAIRVHCALHHLDGEWPAPYDTVLDRAKAMLASGMRAKADITSDCSLGNEE